MKRRERRQEQLEGVKREYQTALIAARILGDQLQQNPSVLGRMALRPTDLRNLQSNLEATYTIRLFAEFETGLRQVWTRTVRDTHPKASDLIDSLGARRRIASAVVRDVHEVRQYRNILVHEESMEAQPIPFLVAARRLRRYFSHMPSDWQTQDRGDAER